MAKLMSSVIESSFPVIPVRPFPWLENQKDLELPTYPTRRTFSHVKITQYHVEELGVLASDVHLGRDTFLD